MPVGLILILVLPEDNFVIAALLPAQQSFLQELQAKLAPLKLFPEEQHSRTELFPQIYEILKIRSNKTIPYTTTRFMDDIKTAVPACIICFGRKRVGSVQILITAASIGVLDGSMINTRRTDTISKI